MAESITKVNKFVEKRSPVVGFVKRSGGSFLSDFFESTADFAKQDKARLKAQEAKFEAGQRQEQAESFKPVAAAPAARKRMTGGKRQTESLLTRKV